jgi:hypothetical protein
MRSILAVALLCLLSAGCQRCGICPEVTEPAEDFCKGGFIVTGLVDECGCEVPAQCLKPECGPCPVLMPPGPGFCPDGNITVEKDICGCLTAPRCNR